MLHCCFFVVCMLASLEETNVNSSQVYEEDVFSCENEDAKLYNLCCGVQGVQE